MLVQQVPPSDGSAESWTVLGDDFAVIEPIDVFLAHLSLIERSPGTVRSYAFDLRDYFTFLDAHRIDWVTVRLEHLGRFVAWLRLPPDARSGAATALPTAPPHCSARRSTGNCPRWPRFISSTSGTAWRALTC